MAVLAPVDVEALIREAEEATGLSDWDGETFRDHLALLARDVFESRPRPEALEHAARRWRAALVRRLRMVQYRTDHPEVVEERIVAPLVVVGLPRTGSTHLGGFLAQDPAHRCMGPIEDRPFPVGAGEEEIGVNSNVDVGPERSEDPGFLSKHRMDVPQTDGHLLGYEFFDPVHTYRTPAYLEHVLDGDATVAYEWHRRALQYGQHRDRRERWALRSWAHSYHIEEFLVAYPDARVLWTHRDPVKVFASIASLFAYVRQPNYVEPLDLVDLGRRSSALWDLSLRRLLEFRDRHADDHRFFDVIYQDLAEEPLRVLRAAYEHFDLPFPAPTQEAMAAWAQENTREKYEAGRGRHEYTAQDYGIDPDEVSRTYADYRDRFGIAAGV